MEGNCLWKGRAKKRRLCCRGMEDLIMPAPSDIRRFLGLLFQRLGRVGGVGGGANKEDPLEIWE